MTFNATTFQTINSKKNVAVRTALNSFEGTVSSSGLSIKLPLNGVEHYRIGKSEYAIQPGNFLLVNKGQEIGCRLKSKQNIESICIYLDSALYTEIHERLHSKDPLDFSSASHEVPVLPEKYYMLDCELSESLRRLSHQKSLDTLTEEDFILLTEKLAFHQLDQKRMISSIEALNYITKKELLIRLRTARSFIFDNYDRDINLDDIAQVSYLSKYHLLRSFKDVYKITPYQALLKRRIDKAAELLRQEHRIQDVAIRCGFNDRRSFSRVFKKMHGVTPSNFMDR